MCVVSRIEPASPVRMTRGVALYYEDAYAHKLGQNWHRKYLPLIIVEAATCSRTVKVHSKHPKGHQSGWQVI